MSRQKCGVFSTRKHLLTIDSIYAYPHNHTPIFEITLLHNTCRVSTLTFNKFFWAKQNIYYHMMNKQVITNVFLTKEALEQYALKLREEKAKQHGMTLEEWDRAVFTGQVVTPVSGSSN